MNCCRLDLLRDPLTVALLKIFSDRSLEDSETSRKRLYGTASVWCMFQGLSKKHWTLPLDIPQDWSRWNHLNCQMILTQSTQKAHQNHVTRASNATLLHRSTRFKPYTWQNVQTATMNDTTSRQLLDTIEEGWPSMQKKLLTTFQKYHRFKNNLYILDGSLEKTSSRIIACCTPRHIINNIAINVLCLLARPEYGYRQRQAKVR